MIFSQDIYTIFSSIGNLLQLSGLICACGLILHLVGGMFNAHKSDSSAQGKFSPILVLALFLGGLTYIAAGLGPAMCMFGFIMLFALAIR